MQDLAGPNRVLQRAYDLLHRCEAVPPALPAFLAAHPDVEVELPVDDAAVDIVAKGFDAGVRFGELLAGDMTAVPIGLPSSSPSSVRPPTSANARSRWSRPTSPGAGASGCGCAGPARSTIGSSNRTAASYASRSTGR